MFAKKDFKDFIGYKDAKKNSLCILLSKTSAYRRDFDETKCTSFLIKMMNYLENILKSEKKSEKQKHKKGI